MKQYKNISLDERNTFYIFINEDYFPETYDPITDYIPYKVFTSNDIGQTNVYNYSIPNNKRNLYISNSFFSSITNLSGINELKKVLTDGRINDVKENISKKIRLHATTIDLSDFWNFTIPKKIVINYSNNVSTNQIKRFIVSGTTYNILDTSDFSTVILEMNSSKKLPLFNLMIKPKGLQYIYLKHSLKELDITNKSDDIILDADMFELWVDGDLIQQFKSSKSFQTHVSNTLDRFENMGLFPKYKTSLEMNYKQPRQDSYKITRMNEISEKENHIVNYILNT